MRGHKLVKRVEVASNLGVEIYLIRGVFLKPTNHFACYGKVGLVLFRPS